MDYSNLNISLWNAIIQLGIISTAILVSNTLRRKVRFIRDSLMPTAVLGGFLLLFLRTVGIIELDIDFLETLVYHGIALGFIAMSLRIVAKSAQSGNLAGPKSGAIIVGSYLIQAIVGLIISIGLAYTVMPDMFKAAGILLPMGYGQGPGQANNVGTTYEAVGFVGGRSFGLALAATGFLCACIVGVIGLNILARKGKVKRFSGVEVSGTASIESFQDDGEMPVSESVDKFSIQIALVLFVYIATYLVTRLITGTLLKLTPGLAATLNPLLWGFNFIIGSALAILTRVVLKKMRDARVMTRQYQNNYLLNRISGVFFDIMIIAGIASINIGSLTGLWLPLVLMSVAGGVVSWYFLAWVCKKAYKGYYYEGIMSMYGMMTGTISSGVLLLREIDPNLETPAANNLITGSSFAIIFGAPMLVLIGLAYKSTAMTFVTLGLCVVYLALMLLFIFKVNSRKSDKKK
ncbi:MAG: hypothetical protein LBN30_08675 [Oscillospiraceae bacterium]|jgi:ESS family glutamate:Na+ symporter|nr:hypothetical protein [Oscillospiraceae bacterium]